MLREMVVKLRDTYIMLLYDDDEGRERAAMEFYSVCALQGLFFIALQTKAISRVITNKASKQALCPSKISLPHLATTTICTTVDT